MQIQHVEYGDILETFRVKEGTGRDVLAVVWVSPDEDLLRIAKAIPDPNQSMASFLDLISENKIRFMQINDGLHDTIFSNTMKEFHFPDETECLVIYSQNIIFFKTKEPIW